MYIQYIYSYTCCTHVESDWHSGSEHWTLSLRSRRVEVGVANVQYTGCLRHTREEAVMSKSSASVAALQLRGLLDVEDRVVDVVYDKSSRQRSLRHSKTLLFWPFKAFDISLISFLRRFSSSRHQRPHHTAHPWPQCHRPWRGVVPAGHGSPPAALETPYSPRWYSQIGLNILNWNLKIYSQYAILSKNTVYELSFLEIKQSQCQQTFALSLPETSAAPIPPWGSFCPRWDPTKSQSTGGVPVVLVFSKASQRELLHFGIHRSSGSEIQQPHCKERIKERKERNKETKRFKGIQLRIDGLSSALRLARRHGQTSTGGHFS